MFSARALSISTSNRKITMSPSLDFPVALKLNRLNYGSNILLHLRQRADLNLGHIGERLQPVLAAFRTIRPECLDQFFELLSGILSHLEKYAALAESCSKSGAYQDKRQVQLNNVLTLLLELEKQDDVMRLLESMRRQ